MENNNQPTNNFDFDFTLIANFFKSLDRQGPGGKYQTLRALDFVKDNLNAKPQIADLGCGTGGQTVTLAKALPDSYITAIDLLEPMIEGLHERIARGHFESQITAMQASMDALPFATDSLDMIWAEGSIYHMGYKKGLDYWHGFLKPDGYIALTECCWLSDRRPDKLKWFTDNFAEIDTIAQKLAILQSAGYESTAHFILPSECWTQNYYKPMRERMVTFEADNRDNPSAKMLVEQLKGEIAQYERYGHLYGYVFFVGRKI